MSQKSSTPDNHDAELKARLDKLSGAIKAERGSVEDGRKAAVSPTSTVGMGTAIGTGFRVTSELVAGMLVGGFIGWWLDHWLGTKPIALLITVMIGMVAGFWNVYRIAARPTGGGQSGTK
ncbi:MAG: AtpZ/AtpI family protein [Methylocystis sp.]|nr:AtpZ/AtpI family protein [Methylocystis sp.]MCA3582527.1 AtpZ/AtpI family protein [Methylocystis sp.]MCA3589428.1 AtpZ/AtpI family protein [Methylocystis sp.]MCA3591086.1 AtpZ/AtpI family protein [Methylocystis sp.]